MAGQFVCCGRAVVLLLIAALVTLAVYLRHGVFLSPEVLSRPRHVPFGGSKEPQSTNVAVTPLASAETTYGGSCEKTIPKLWSVADVIGDPEAFCSRYNETPRDVTGRPKILYAIMFGVEEEMLEIVLHEIYPVVDEIFITESTSTHSQKPKRLLWDRIKSSPNFAIFDKKITAFVFSPARRFKSGWDIEKRQRSFFMRGLSKNNLTTDDIIIGNADLDELFSRSLLLRFKFCKVEDTHFNAFHFRYNLNCLQEAAYTTYYSTVFRWPGDAAQLRGIDLYRRRTYRKNFAFNATSPDELNGLMGKGRTVWHMTAFGGVASVLVKYENSPHRFVGELSKEGIAQDIRNCWFNGNKGIPIATPKTKNLPYFVQHNLCYYTVHGWLRGA